jgi:hypothetical protein
MERFDHAGLEIVRTENGRTIRADNAALYAWAHRTGNYWPASALAMYDEIMVGEDARGDLVDLEIYVGGKLLDSEDERVLDLAADELKAFADDCEGR